MPSSPPSSLLSLLPPSATFLAMDRFNFSEPISAPFTPCWKDGPGPTATSHYITPTLVGGGMANLEDIPSLESHLDIVVCLRSEYTSSQYFTSPDIYPRSLVCRGIRTDMLFIHFPAHDFEAFPDDDDLVRVRDVVVRYAYDVRVKLIPLPRPLPPSPSSPTPPLRLLSSSPFPLFFMASGAWFIVVEGTVAQQ